MGDNYFIGIEGEQRYQVIGMTRRQVLLLGVFVDRSQPDKAVNYEENIYNDQFR